MVSMKTLAERFTYAREHGGYTKAELSRVLKLSRASVGQIESGITRTLKASTLIGLEKATGISAEWVETGRGAPRTTPKLPPGSEAQVSKILQEFVKLPPEHQAKIEMEIDFLLSLKDRK